MFYGGLNREIRSASQTATFFMRLVIDLSRSGGCEVEDLGDSGAGEAGLHVPAAVADARPPHHEAIWLISKISLLFNLARRSWNAIYGSNCGGCCSIYEWRSVTWTMSTELYSSLLPHC